jgi:predicted nucleic acid-binding protein
VTARSQPADGTGRGISAESQTRLVVVDTTVLVDLLRGEPEAKAWLAALPTAPYCSEITRVEVIRGLRSAERAPAHRLFAGLRWVPLTDQVATLAGELGRDYRRSHVDIAAADLVVAATAMRLDADLATHNVRNFQMFTGLAPPY